MTEMFLKFTECSNADLNKLIDNRLLNLNMESHDYFDISIFDVGHIFRGWIDINTTYLPLGIDAKGFRVDRKVIVDFIHYLRKHNVESFNSEYLIKYIHGYSQEYFGTTIDELNRRKIYRFGYPDSIGKYIYLSSLKEKFAASFMEKAALDNVLFNFMGFDSSLVISNVGFCRWGYCLIKLDEKYKIVGPLSNIFDLDVEHKKCEVETTEGVLIYEFPFNNLEKLKQLKR